MGATAAVLSIGASAYNTISGFSRDQRAASAASAQGQYAKAVDENNAKMSDMEAQDATDRGQVAAQRQGLETRQRIGASRAAMAAQGVDVGSGSALDVQGSEAAIGAMDEQTIRNNAAREAWGYKVQAINERQQGQVAAITGDSAAAGYRAESFGSLLTGAVNTYGLAQKYNNDRRDLRGTQFKTGFKPGWK